VAAAAAGTEIKVQMVAALAAPVDLAVVATVMVWLHWPILVEVVAVACTVVKHRADVVQMAL
jgi:hypothetical protein